MAFTAEQLKAWIDANWGNKLNALTGPFSNRPAEMFVPTIYVCTDTGDIYIWVDDPSQDTWVQVNGGVGGGIPEAPQDGRIYGRRDGEWVEVTAAVEQIIWEGGISNSTYTEIFEGGLSNSTFTEIFDGGTA